LPTILLYEVSIWLARMIERSRAKEKTAEETEAPASEIAPTDDPARS
ncbi:MAG: twin-arginine translocase subunit TatC, partial [Rhizobiaceae bacterium]